MDIENDGWDMEKFEELIKKKKYHMGILISNFQNPTGIVWSDEKKKRLIQLAKDMIFI